MLVHIKEILHKAERGGYAIGAFNIVNLETARAVVNAAATLRAPVILQATEKTFAYGGFSLISNIMKTAAKTSSAPVAIHLDHGKNKAIVQKCIEAGFSSVMRDASHLPFHKNIQAVRAIVRIASRRKVYVQGELGSILGKEGLILLKEGKIRAEDLMTDPSQVHEFVRLTGIHALAISVGTMHGAFFGKEKIDFERLRKIRKESTVPLVLHGGSGIPPRDIKRAIRMGIRIVNVDTEIRIAFLKTLRNSLKKKLRHYDPREIFASSIKSMQDVVEEKIRIFGSARKA